MVRGQGMGQGCIIEKFVRKFLGCFSRSKICPILVVHRVVRDLGKGQGCIEMKFVRKFLSCFSR